MQFQRTTLSILSLGKSPGSKTSKIIHLQLNRPEVVNAFDLQMFHELDFHMKSFAKDRHLRAVIISATGTDFSTGLDIKSLMQSQTGLFKLAYKTLPWRPNLAQRMCTGWQKIPCPVIVAIHGRCWGAGLQLALGADIRIASPDSQLSIMETKWGLVPDMGGSVILPSLVGRDKAFQWTALSQQISATEAQAAGLITEIHPSPFEAAKELAELFCKQSPDALAASKRLYQKAYRSLSGTQLLREFVYQAKLLMGRNRKTAVKSALKKEEFGFAPREHW